MIGAIEFLRKAKAICVSRPSDNNGIACDSCPAYEFCTHDIDKITYEAELVKSVMDYEIKESQEVNPCSICEENQLLDCIYLENDDRKSCAKIIKHEIKEED